MRAARRIPMRKCIPNKIRALRLRSTPRLRQVDLAACIGCSKSDVGKYERGVRIPSMPMALKIAHALATPVEDVFWYHAEVARGGRTRRETAPAGSGGLPPPPTQPAQDGLGPSP